jgi:hypothetical protein
VQVEREAADQRTLAQKIQAAREEIAAAAGLDVSRVKIVLDYCD